MEISNQDLLKDTFASLKGKWGAAIVGLIIYMAVSIGAQILGIIPIAGVFIALFIGWITMYGYKVFHLELLRENKSFNTIFVGYQRAVDIIVTYLIYSILVFLWSLLLIVPGIIKAIAYSQTFYIMYDDENIKYYDALKKSQEMMKGYKMKFFLLVLSYFLITLIVIPFTLGIGIFWLLPYIQTTNANFYKNLKGEDVSELDEIGIATE